MLEYFYIELFLLKKQNSSSTTVCVLENPASLSAGKHVGISRNYIDKYSVSRCR